MGSLNTIRIRTFFILMLLHFATAGDLFSQDTIFHEGFENSGNNMPSGWINEMIVNDGIWKVGEGAGPFPGGQVGLPDTAAVGEKNVYFRVPHSNPYITRLITPPIDLEFAIYPELTFWHAQVPREGQISTLVVYMAESINGPWTAIGNYQNPVMEWTQRIIQLPGGTPTLYLAFEGHSGGGLCGSVCFDEVTVVDVGEMEREISAIETYQPTTNFVPSGTQNNQVLQTRFRVIGNTGAVNVEEFTVNSLNTDDNDLAPQGVKLWFTQDENFNTDNLLASGKDFQNGQVVFDNLIKSLPTGYSYFWITFDIAEDAQDGNFVEAYIPAGGIVVNGEAFPEEDHNPPGKREIYETIFYDNFEEDKGWILTGEWERDIPEGLGGQGQPNCEGPAGPTWPYVGTKVLGTDITGLGEYPGNYEPHLEEHAYQAIMPMANCFYYNNVTLVFHQWLNIYMFHRATIDISVDGGDTWEQVWYNSGIQNATSWSQVSRHIPQAERQEEVLIRFTIGDTGGQNLQSGWHIDNLVLTGNFVTKDVGVAEWIYPESSCGMSDQEEVTVVVRNYGAEPSPDVIPVAFSLDGGATWKRDTLYGSIPVGGHVEFTFTPTADFSVPGRYDQVLAKTELPEDQDTSNDQHHTKIFSIPTYIPYYSEDYQENDGYWTAYGENNSWQRAAPYNTVINGAFAGDYAWVTSAYGYYNPDEYSWVESPCFDFSDIQNPVLEFYLKTHTPTGIAGAAMDYSLDGGTTWERIQPRESSLAWNWYNHSSIGPLADKTGDGFGWTGNTSGWINPRIVLPEETGYQSAVRFRMVFASDPVPMDYEGVVFDMVKVYQAPNDIGIAAFTDPQSGCELSQQQTITVAIENYGINIMAPGIDIPVGLDFHNDGNTYLEEFVLADSLLPGQTVSYTFEQVFDMAEPGNYAFTAYTMLPGDTTFYGNLNDSLSADFNVYGFPTVDIGEDIWTTQPDTILLDAGPGFNTYLWQDSSSDQTFQVTSPQTKIYSVTVTDENNCPATDSMEVVTYDLALTELISPTDGCQLADGEPVIAELTNLGHDSFPEGTEVPMDFYFEGQLEEEMIFVLQEALLPGQAVQVVFNTILDLSETGDYDVEIIHHFEDAEPGNNHLITTVSAVGYPPLDLGDDIYTTQPDTVQLDAGPGWAQYLWQDGYDGQIYDNVGPQTATYSVTITDAYGCSNDDDVKVITFDTGLADLVSPADDCELSDEEPIIVALENFGADTFDAGETFDLKLYLDSELLAEETMVLSENWPPSETVEYTFSQTVDMSAEGEYHFTIVLDHLDANPDNKELNASVTVTGYPNLVMPSTIVTDEPDTVLLNAGPGFASYLWFDGTTSQTYQVNDWGNYWVTVANEIGCETTDTTAVVAEFLDFALHELVSPGHSCENELSDIPVVVSVMNAGNVPIIAGEEILLYYEAGYQKATSEIFVLDYDLDPGHNIEYTFSEHLNLSKYDYFNFKVWLQNENDENPDNDTLDLVLDIYPLPQPHLGDTIFDPTPQGIVLDPGAGFETYLWQDGSTGSTYQVNSPYSEWYQVAVSDLNGCVNSDSVKVIAYDLEVKEIISPASNCTLSVEEAVIFSLKNHGPDTFEPGFVFQAGYYVNGANQVIDEFILTQTLSPGEQVAFAFPDSIDLSGEEIIEMTFTLKNKDVNLANNELIGTIEAPGLPFVNLGSDIYTANPDTIVLDAGYGFASYLWHDGNTGQYYSVYQYGWHMVQVTDQFGCAASDTLFIGQTTGIDDPEGSVAGVAIYPNPANHQVNIRIERTGAGPIGLKMFSQTGNLVLTKRMEADSPVLEETIDLFDLKPGVYYIRIIENNKVITKRLVVAPRQ